MSSFSPLAPAPAGAGCKRRLTGLTGSALSLTISRLARQHQGVSLLITQDTPSALHLEQELSYLCPEMAVTLFPDREVLPYDSFSPHQDIVSQRLEALYRLPQTRSGLVIVPVNTALVRLPPVDYVGSSVLLLEPGQRIDIDALRHNLTQAGYHHVEQVYEHGEFAVRGAIIDLFPMGSDQPLRLDLFDDELESIRTFDVDSQRTQGSLERVRLLPAREFPTHDKAIEGFRSRWGQHFSRISNETESVYQQISRGLMPAGVENYLPLFFETTATLFDYLPEQVQLMTTGEIQGACDKFLADARQRFDNYGVDPLRPLLPPQTLFLNTEELFSQMKPHGRIQLSRTLSEIAREPRAKAAAIGEVAVNHQLKVPTQALAKRMAEARRTLFSVESEGRREALLELLRPMQLTLTQFDHLDSFLEADAATGIIVSPLEQSVLLEQEGLALICEEELLGGRVRQRRRQRKTVSSDTLIRNLAELKVGQPVVHLKHGVGSYQGLQTLEAGGMSTEFLVLEYKDQAKLYVPVSALHLISRYSAGEESEVQLNRLGSEAWDRARRKAAEKVRDVAAELLDIYARRESKPGHAFELDELEYQRFSAGFPFEETLDQHSAIDAVVRDMRTSSAMDRLVCGDVGFGKTEVAMRAAFVAVAAGKQVAVLVPTTLLAQQHFENFRDRFADWPVRIEVMSRFKTAGEQKQVLGQLAEGKVDIVIGTHKLLQSDIQFTDLGLLIVDEEHRFGVRQKEQIKALRAEVDILTLTATPIPRTLNMAMSGMRDLSIIATPPARRLSVKTFVRPREGNLIREALMREILRGGQVYFLHNSVETIEQCAKELAELVPEARFAIAHGQMRERELERVMSDFHHQRFNVLVCTTIIETGIDIPSANTIVIERADRFGLAQLHQLRGRVGRSHHQAYAYLLTQGKKLTKDAKKRLEAIEQLEDLGAGFMLATQDLEIRGAGELLGDEQSGHIAKVGFSLYMDMLEQTVSALKAGKEPSLDQILADQTELELKIPALLPEEYIPHVNTRLAIYKRIASCTSTDELTEARVELVDRFGRLPDASENLLSLTRLKLRAMAAGIRRIDAHAKGGSIEFGPDTKVTPEILIGLLQSQAGRLKMDGPNKLRFQGELQEPAPRLEAVEQLLSQLGI
ncbi:transcription-repair coupling factor [Ferrimonas sediminicola]|uniref:Transcription-repair-coupling factor n=1 Tax=Ferrimonas sediminicola TaxID=2569538 RepID=A0A4U1BD66_9GAMM|nr:transcription-repair coupling factor [Ferrimonas sediminicola]TKB49019.1 transcription-repair coupling factor [Ferrimonas sediminicola]